LALAILATLLLVAWTLVVRPVVELSAGRRADVAALSEQLAQLEAVAARRPELDERARLARERFTASGGFWTGASVPAVSASIQNLIRQATVASGGQLRSASEGVEMADRGFRRVTVRFGVGGTLETVQQTLAAVDRATPSLFVESVSIRSSDGGLARDRPPTLSMELGVFGYLEPSRP
jgi:multidrug resistance efflux pump